MQLDEHGTLKQYRRGCRCDRCKRANADYQKAYQAKRKAKLAAPAGGTDEPAGA